MKNIFFFLLFFITINKLYSQPICGGGYNCSGYCQVNVFDTDPFDSRMYNLPWRKPVIDATFLFQTTGSCTGTLINRNVGDGELGYYFVTANHCVEAIGGAGSETESYLIFNFQSPDNVSFVDISNRGQAYRQQSTSQSSNGYQYIHKTRIKVIDREFWGDFALMQIVDPLPEHFDFTYAGWSPSRFHVPGPLLPYSPTLYAAVHHPVADIKK